MEGVVLLGRSWYTIYEEVYTMAMDTLAEKKQKILNSYQRAMDYEVAILSAQVTDAELEEIEKDTLFKAQIRLVDVQFRERLIDNLKDLANPAKTKTERVRLEAVKELGNLFYGERFKQAKDEDNEKAKIVIMLPTNGRESK